MNIHMPSDRTHKVVLPNARAEAVPSLGLFIVLETTNEDKVFQRAERPPH